ncbi:nSTAND1 domain-containing NTPase [Egbenema bharatensis]|uniref:nSTAND1 domain-containing NTPase n=1 Tax=Egbenema bharatensis TaxID=3463334 RepID=UPI003A865B1D
MEELTERSTTRQTPGLWTLGKHDKGEYIFLTPGHALNLPPAPPLDASQNPYRGLASFDESDRDLFFGRKALTQQLAEFVNRHTLTVVLGASGSGKSSLVKAGLIPHLRQSELEPPWQIVPPFRLGESPCKALYAALHSLSTSVGLEQSESLPSACMQGFDEWFHKHPDTDLLMVIDQFEELITLCRDLEEQSVFFNLLAEAVKKYSDRLHLVLTVRSDFEPQFRKGGLDSLWFDSRFIVPAMNRTELRAAIEEPASKRVMYFDPHRLVDQLIDEVMLMPGALPLLSFTLSELYLSYLKRQDTARSQGNTVDRAITQADYDALGGVARSLTQRADQEYESLVKMDADCAHTVRHVLLRMIALGGDELARRRVFLSELTYPEPEQTRVNQVLNQFTNARLLVRGTDNDDRPFIEPAHDALVRGWQRLLQWKNEAQEKLILQRRLTPAAEDWQQQQSAKYLWNADPRLEWLNQILHTSHHGFNQVETEFVRRSVGQRRRNTYLRWGIVASTILVLSGITFSAVRANRTSSLQAEAITVKSLLAIDPLESLLRAIRAVGQNHAAVAARLWTRPIEAVDASLLSALEVAKERNRFSADTQKRVNAVAVSQTTIVSGGRDGTINIWDLQGNRLGSPIPAEQGQVRAVAVSANGETIASAGSDGTIRLWTPQGEPIAPPLRGHTGEVLALAMTADGQGLASGGKDGTIRFWNRQGQPLGTAIDAEAGTIEAIAISPNQPQIATGSSDGTVRLWNLQGNLIVPPFQGHQGNVEDIDFSPDGRQIVSSGSDGTVRIWNLQGNSIGNPVRGHRGTIFTVAFSPDGQTLVSGGEDETIRTWKLDGSPSGQILTPLMNGINTIAITPDSQTIIGGGGDGTIGLWDLQPSPFSYPFNAMQGAVNAIDLAEDGQALVSGGSDGTVRLWDIQGNTLQPPFQGHERSVRSVAFSSAGDWIVSGGEDGMVRLWDREGNSLVEPIREHLAAIRTVVISPDGQWFASGSDDGTVRLWNRQGNSIANPISADTKAGVHAVAISPDGQRIATGGADGRVRLWDQQGNPIAPSFQGHGEGVFAVAFSPDGQIIASGGADATIRLWDGQGNPIGTPIQGHQATITAIDFSPDGHFLVSSSDDRTVRWWTIDGRTVALLSNHSDRVSAALFTPDGQQIISSSRDGTIRLARTVGWSDWLEAACQQLQDHAVFRNPGNGLEAGARRTCEER